MEHVRAAPPTNSVFPGRTLWAAVHAIDDDDLGAAARAENAEAAARIGMPHFTLAVDAIEAVVLGREGKAAEATALIARTREAARHLPGSDGTHVLYVLIARAALRDGWGDPVTWLREAEAFFAAGGYDRTARRCRTMLGAAGVPDAPAGPRHVERPDGAAGPRRHRAGRSTCSSSWRRACPTGRSGRSCSCPRRPSSGTSAASCTGPGRPTGPRSASWRGPTASKMGDAHP